MTVSELQKILSKQEKSDVVEFGLKFRDSSKLTLVDELEEYCGHLHELLFYAKQCVDAIAKHEKKTGRCSMYYDKRRGLNGGARDLSKDLKDAIDGHYEKMLYFSTKAE